jgi:hypothetical protein
MCRPRCDSRDVTADVATAVPAAATRHETQAAQRPEPSLSCPDVAEYTDLHAVAARGPKQGARLRPPAGQGRARELNYA